MTDVPGDIHAYGIDIKNREIYLHSYISNVEEDPGVEYRMATTFIKNLRLLDSQSERHILIHMHSVGGEWNDGMAIYDAILLCRSYVTIIVYGQAESMSSIILQAADQRIMMPNAYFMCHFGSSENDGNFLDVQNFMKFENKTLDIMIDIYSEVATNGKFFKEHYKNVTQDKVKNYIKRKMKEGDWYLDSNETVYYGFADSVITSNTYGSINSLKQ